MQLNNQQMSSQQSTMIMCTDSHAESQKIACIALTLLKTSSYVSWKSFKSSASAPPLAGSLVMSMQLDGRFVCPAAPSSWVQSASSAT